MQKEKIAFNHQFLTLPTELDGISELIELALDLRWSWNRRTDRLWKWLDAELWETMKNPWNILKTVSHAKLKQLLADPEFLALVKNLAQANREDDQQLGWFDKNYANSSLKTVAYFSMEYMLTEALPIYSGGLGNVAGDQLKAASDLNVPIIGIGLLYQQGYFRQFIDKQGAQQALYPYNDPGQLPITPLRRANGEWLRLKLDFPGWSLWIRAWQVEVGRTTLLLLDSNDSVNPPFHRGITSELYGGGPELRLKQELLLGIGGWKLLQELAIEPEVCHLNEGHAAFAILERAKSLMIKEQIPFETALAITREGNLFTTHTAVPAGFDRFSPDLMERYLARYANQQLQISFKELMALGRCNAQDEQEYFNMAYLAMRGSGAANAVSALHGRVSRHLFQSLYPSWPTQEVPIGYVTNGIHVASWNSPASDDLWKEACGSKRWLGETEQMQRQLEQVSDKKIWQMRIDQKQAFVQYIRQKLSKDLAASGAPWEEVELAGKIFDPNCLTLGFSRRFATYKRTNLLLSDPERLIKILTNPQKPVQLVLAGKAHPADIPGQNLILDWHHFLKRPEIKNRVVFLSDYDMLVAEQMVSGVDLWINTPRRPWEACGTSGMKVLANGGVNLSELDGWWAEAFSPQVGWALGDEKEHGDDPAWDALEAEALYSLLENEVTTEFYQKDKEEIPFSWVKRIRHSMATLTPLYSANRSVREYTEKYYLLAADNFLKRVSTKGEAGKKIVEWKQQIKENWPSVKLEEVNSEKEQDHYLFAATLFLAKLSPEAISVELYAENSAGEAIVEPMERITCLNQEKSTFFYQAKVAAMLPVDNYTVRVVPFYTGAKVPLEEKAILWQR